MVFSHLFLPSFIPYLISFEVRSHLHNISFVNGIEYNLFGGTVKKYQRKQCLSLCTWIRLPSRKTCFFIILFRCNKSCCLLYWRGRGLSSSCFPSSNHHILSLMFFFVYISFQNFFSWNCYKCNKFSFRSKRSVKGVNESTLQ